RRRCGEFPVESCRPELVTLRRATARRRHAGGRNRVVLHVLRIAGKGFQKFARNRAAANSSRAFDGAIRISGYEVQDVALQCTLQLLSGSKSSGYFAILELERELMVYRVAED